MGARGVRPMDPLQRLWRSVLIHADDCWLWTGPTNSQGYPVVGGWRDKQYVVRWLHARRRALEPTTRFFRTCDTARCVNPDHHQRTDADQRFWSNVAGAEPLDCWLWQGHLVRGYGRYHGVLAHRWAYEQLIAPIPAGLTLDHLCFTPSCVNPWHLDPVPQSVNSRRENDRRKAVAPPATLADALL